jgi:signal transduction histidine kinase
MAESSDKKSQPEKHHSTRSPKSPRRLQISLPFTVGAFSSVPSTERLLTSVLSGAPVIVCVIDPQLNITFIDGKGLEALHLSPGQVVDHPFLELVRDSDELRSFLNQAFAGNIVRTTLPVRERMFRVTFIPVILQQASISGVIFVATDLNTRDQPAEPVAHFAGPHEDLVQQVTHELRTPLNSVLGFANLLLRSKDSQLSEQDRFYLERILGNTSHLLQIIGQVLDLSLHTAGKLPLESVTVDLKILVEEILGELKGLAWSGTVTLLAQVPEGTQQIRTDRIRLKQILINLISNALKYTEKGSIIVSVHADAELRPVRIDVTDTGEGIPNESLRAVFEAFERGTHNNDRAIEGVGLGLSIARTLSTMLGYTLEVRSEAGKGSTFSIHLIPLPTPL